MQNITIAGRLTRDAEIKTSQSGDSFASFAVAVSNKKGEQATFYDCSIWGRRGEALCQYLTKGSPVTVSGALAAGLYEGRDGQPRVSLKVRVNEIALQGSAPQGGDEFGGF